MVTRLCSCDDPMTYSMCKTFVGDQQNGLQNVFFSSVVLIYNVQSCAYARRPRLSCRDIEASLDSSAPSKLLCASVWLCLASSAGCEMTPRACVAVWGYGVVKAALASRTFHRKKMSLTILRTVQLYPAAKRLKSCNLRNLDESRWTLDASFIWEDLSLYRY